METKEKWTTSRRIWKTYSINFHNSTYVLRKCLLCTALAHKNNVTGHVHSAVHVASQKQEGNSFQKYFINSLDFILPNDHTAFPISVSMHIFGCDTPYIIVLLSVIDSYCG